MMRIINPTIRIRHFKCRIASSERAFSTCRVLNLNGVLRIVNAPKAHTSYDNDSTLQMSNSEVNFLFLVKEK